MTTELVRRVELPAPTPRLTDTLTPQECAAHRKAMAFEIDAFMASSAYWMPQESEQVRKAALADWVDELEDWSLTQVRWALREFRSANGSKRPGPQHILPILISRRGREWLKTQPAATAEPANPEPVTADRATEILKEVGYRVNKFGGVE